ncbi:CDP-glycerol glycerophosphotransferase family protein [Methylobacterium brachiatum]
MERALASGRRISVLFVVHFKEVWTSLEAVYSLMCEDDRFSATIAVINFSMLGETPGNGWQIARMLRNSGYNFVDLSYRSDADINRFLDNLKPDYLFRQTPWEGSFPSPLKTGALIERGIKLLYVPYNMHIVDHPDVTINQEYILNTSLYFCFCQQHYDDYKEKSLANGRNAVLTGSPKLDRIVTENDIRNESIMADRTYCVMWAPHHSVDANHLGFGSFPRDFSRILDFAATNPAIKFLFRPHPLLEAVLSSSFPEIFRNYGVFLEKWNSLKNAETDRNADCAPGFRESDCLITDGISFLVEYQIAGKPLIFIDNAPDMKLTSVGSRAKAHASIVHSMSEALDVVTRLRLEGAPHQQSTNPAMEWLRPFPGQAAVRIVEAIHSDFVAAGSGGS